ncbi:MAG: LysM peptidoglycan-binding domain-containing protein [Nitrospirae bacterium]|nr:LysM peptidoglycan-binding domain-containing protein [Nitrospirota bacterium]
MKIRYWIAAFILPFVLAVFDASATQTYTVRKGDSLCKIAKKFRVEQERLRETNSPGSSALKPGMKLILPPKEAAETKAGLKHKKRESARAAETRKRQAAVSGTGTEEPAEHDVTHYTVRKGDTLGSIARKYSISVNGLKQLNDIGRSSRLKPGRRLLVKKTGPATYTVKKGDTIWKIARKFSKNADELLDLNQLDPDELKPGQKLILEEPARPGERDHSVLAQAKISEDIKSLSESPELNALTMKDRLILFAKKMLNIPYRFGGSNFMGIDCSGYVQKVFGLLDVTLPRTAREQFHMGEPVRKEDLSIGDLVFFRTYASFPSHVGIYLGNNLFIHASSRSRKVSIDSLETPYYIKRFIGAKRLFEDDLETKTDRNESG